MKRHRPLITPVRQYADRWGFDDYFTTGKRIQVRRSTRKSAQDAFTDLSVLIANGRKDLAGIDPVELAKFRQYNSRQLPRISLSKAIAAFIQSKHCSHRHIYGLGHDLNILQSDLGDINVSEITRQDLQQLLDGRNVGPRRRFNLRAGFVNFFHWLRAQSYLPDEPTAADQLAKIDRVPGDVHILSPQQMRTLLDNVRHEFLPWLIIGAFAGVRSEEIAPDTKSGKSPLLWQDFKWTRRLIDLRRETAKTGKKRRPQRRIIPITDNLFEWLRPWHNAIGRVCERQPTRWETKRLGKFIGGKWPHNCLRDSYGSYWMAIHKNMPELAYQMGNSVQMIEQSYHERQDESDANEYFAIMPLNSGHKKVTAFNPQIVTSSH